VDVIWSGLWRFDDAGKVALNDMETCLVGKTWWRRDGSR